jgi:putative acetyltransferase
MKITFRPIEKKDNQVIAELIRNVMREFKIDRPGTIYTDPTTDNLYELFETPKSIYWLVEENGIVSGGCGIYPTKALPEGCAELVKFYILAESRGKGFGKQLMQKCLNSAKEFGYTQIYLESLPELKDAVRIYEKSGFRQIDKPLGKSGHHACSLWMVKNLLENHIFVT